MDFPTQMTVDRCHFASAIKIRRVVDRLATKYGQQHLSLGDILRGDVKDISIQNDQVSQLAGGQAALSRNLTAGVSRGHCIAPHGFSHGQTLSWIPAVGGRPIPTLARHCSVNAPKGVGRGNGAIRAKGQYGSSV